MAETWRLLDTGLASPARNIALSRALLESRAADEISSTLRFARSAPGVLLGCRQSAAQELDTCACAALRVPVQRRVTSGSAWFVDERQLEWELHLHRRDVGAVDLQTIGKRVLHAAACALSALGIDARYRARDEIEVEGRTLCRAALAAEGHGVLVQAMLFVDADDEQMMRLLRPALEFHRNAALTRAQARFVGLKDVLECAPDLSRVKAHLAEAFESEFDVELRDSDLSLTEHARYARAIDEIDTRGWVELVARPASDMPLLEAQRSVRAGVLRALIKYDEPARTIRQVQFAGDAKWRPERALFDLEAALRDAPDQKLARQVEWFFGSRAARCEGADAADFIAIIRFATGQPLVA